MGSIGSLRTSEGLVDTQDDLLAEPQGEGRPGRIQKLIDPLEAKARKACDRLAI